LRFAAQAKLCMRKLYLFCLTCISADRYGPFPSRSGCEEANQKACQTSRIVITSPSAIQAQQLIFAVRNIQKPPRSSCFADKASTTIIAKAEARRVQTVRLCEHERTGLSMTGLGSRNDETR
jgi:hypothetical protein